MRYKAGQKGVDGFLQIIVNNPIHHTDQVIRANKFYQIEVLNKNNKIPLNQVP